MKHCAGCRRDLPREQFERDPRRGPYSVKARCVACKAEARAAWQSRNATHG